MDPNQLLDFERRMSALELLLSSTSSSGLGPALEKAVGAVMKQHLGELETRLVAVADSKVDAADCFLKLRNKVEKTDFQKLMDYTIELRQSVQVLNQKVVKGEQVQQEFEKKILLNFEKIQKQINDIDEQKKTDSQIKISDIAIDESTQLLIQKIVPLETQCSNLTLTINSHHKGYINYFLTFELIKQ